jgi:A/G-specific adenine glycosylase
MMADPGERPEAIRDRLVAWGRQNARVYPWRETRDPWKILLAEVMLHRTRADQVVPVYEAAVRKFPDPASLAGASPECLGRLFRPLGLRWRVPLLHEMARRIVRDHGGRVPTGRDELRSLPGVSDYIAGAVRCFAFGEPEPVLDTNAVRVLGRVFGLPVRDSSRRSRRFRELMRELVAGDDPRSLVLAVLDLAALVCRPGNPECRRCPIRDLCEYGRSHGPAEHAPC